MRVARKRYTMDGEQALKHDQRALMDNEAYSQSPASSLIYTPTSSRSSTSRPSITPETLDSITQRLEKMADDLKDITHQLSLPGHHGKLPKDDPTADSNVSSSMPAQNTTRNPGNSQAESQHARKQNPRSYSIAKLLEIGERSTDPSIMLKMKSDAISENLLQNLGVDPKQRGQGRSRGLSNISNFSHASTRPRRSSHFASDEANRVSLPPRQPKYPPEDFASQNDEGFLRFLRQHASPPHQRVTAGGRIVPTGPLSPPPMFDYASLTGIMHGNATGQSTANGAGYERHLKRHWDGTPISYTAQQAPYLGRNGPHLISNSVTTNTSLLQPMPSVPQKALSHAHQPEDAFSTFKPLAIFVDGSTLISYNGTLYRSYSNGPNIVMEPFQMPYQFNDANQGVFNQGSQADSLYAQPSAEHRPPRTPPDQVEREREEIRLSYQEQTLRLQLSRVNEHLAYNHLRIRNTERSSLVAERRRLTEEIEKIRMKRAPVRVNMPIVSNTSAVGRHRTAMSKNLGSTNRSDLQPIGDWQPEHIQDTKKSVLSPNAPAFFPNGGVDNEIAFAAPSPESWPLSSYPSKHQERDEEMVVPSLDEQNGGAMNDDTSGTLDYAPPDPRDPAMRIIHPDDIKYTDHYSNEDRQRFCTTIEQFQEAIRRVREQARLYGCHGGSSKDPAYDAEQDIWWAICDQDPIPRPCKVSRHPRRPQPWNWNESDFNYRYSSFPPPDDRYPPKSPPSSDPLKQANDAMSERFKPSADSGPPSPQFFPSVAGATSPTYSYIPSPEKWLAEKPSTRVNVPHFPPESKSLTATADPVPWMPSPPRKSPGISTPDLLKKGFEAEYMSKEYGCKNPYSDGYTSATFQNLPGHLATTHTYGTVGAESRLNPNERPDLTSDRQCKAVARNLFERYGIKAMQAGSKPKDTSYFDLSKIGPHLSLPAYDPRIVAEYRRLEEEYMIRRWPDDQSRGRLESSTASMGEAVARDQTWQNPTTPPPKPVVNIPSFDNEHEGRNRETSSTTRGLAKKAFLCTEPHIIHDGRFIEVTTHRVEGQPDIHSRTFLRDMLKSPRFTYDFRHLDNTPMAPSMAWQLAEAAKSSRELRRREGGWEASMKDFPGKRDGGRKIEACKKENVASFTDGASKNFGRTTVHSEAMGVAESINTVATKASSSLAASSFQARGYLPPYEGAGKAHTSSLYRQYGHLSPPNQPRVNLGNRIINNHEVRNKLASLIQDIGQHREFSTSSEYNAFPYAVDGSGDLPEENAGRTEDKSKGKEPASAAFDNKGVTKADFDTRRPDHNNPEHHEAVNQFFRDLHAEEVQHMMSVRRQNTKTAP